MPSFRDDLSSFLENPTDTPRRECLFVCDTPSSLVMLGMRQLPIFITKRHVRDIMHPKSPDNLHWHGLGTNELLAVPDLLASPAIILDALDGASRTDCIVCVLSETDSDLLPLVAAIKPDGTSQYECELVDSNHLLSVYGRSRLEEYLDIATRQGHVLFVDEEKTKDLESQAQLQLLRGLRGLPTNHIIHLSRNSPALAPRGDRSNLPLSQTMRSRQTTGAPREGSETPDVGERGWRS